MIRLKRAYEAPAAEDGTRVLVDRLWPRGVSKKELTIDRWARDLAPSDELRRWFDHEPVKWEEFRRRYAAELDEQAEIVAAMLEAHREGTLTLVYAASDPEHNNAVALREYLLHRAG